MKLSHLTDTQLESQFLTLVKQERKILHLVILHIQEYLQRSFYLKTHADLLNYLVKEMHYSHSAACRRIEAAKLASQVPELSKKIESGDLNLSQVNEISRAIKQKEMQTKEKLSQDTKAKLVESVERTTLRETQALLAQALDIPVIVQEKMKAQADDSVRVELTLNSEQMRKFEQVKGLLAQRLLSDKKTMEIASVLETCFDMILEKKLGALTPIPTASAAQSSNSSSNNNSRDSSGSGSSSNGVNVSNSSGSSSNGVNVSNSSGSSSNGGSSGNGSNSSSSDSENGQATVPTQKPWKSLTPKRRQIIFHKFKSCQHKLETGEICQSQFQLEIEHLKPRWAGGSDEEANLTLLCRKHNQRKYKEQAGIT